MHLPTFAEFKERLERLTKDEITALVGRELAAQGRSGEMPNPTLRKDELIERCYAVLGGDPSAESDSDKSAAEGESTPQDGVGAVQDSGDTPAPPAEGSPRGSDPIDAWALVKSGRWRAGLHFTEKPRTFDRAKWADDQRKAIEADPYIRIRELRRAEG